MLSNHPVTNPNLEMNVSNGQCSLRNLFAGQGVFVFVQYLSSNVTLGDEEALSSLGCLSQ